MLILEPAKQKFIPFGAPSEAPPPRHLQGNDTNKHKHKLLPIGRKRRKIKVLHLSFSTPVARTAMHLQLCFYGNSLYRH